MQFTMKATAPGVLTTGQIYTNLITWTGAGSAGDQLVVVDNTGKDIWRSTAPSSDYVLSLSYGERAVSLNGLNVLTMGSGTLTVYYR